MAQGGDSSQEKTEKPTPKRLRDARKKGQTFKSKDLETVLVLAATFAALVFSKSFASEQIQNLMKRAFAVTQQSQVSMGEFWEIGQMAFMTMLKATMPVLITAFLVAGIVGFLQVGALFSLDPLKPQMNKLNMIENIKNMFKPKTFFELIKNILKILIVSFIAYGVIKGMLRPFLLTIIPSVDGVESLKGAGLVGETVLSRFVIRFLIFFLVIAILDYMMQRHDFMKNLMMSKEEIKKEYKEDEGDPHIKSHRKQLHMEMVMGDPKQQVRTADAVVTNPTHIAVAIKYDKKEMMAPQVVAKGHRLFAEYIKTLAKEYEVPIIRNVPLAWALVDLELEQEIPENLYVTVAEVLSFVYRLKEEKEKGQTSLK